MTGLVDLTKDQNTPPAPGAHDSGEPEAGPLFTRASSIEVRPVDWLLFPYIPLGKGTLIAGQMGQAKSLFSLWLTAGVTNGRGLNLSHPGSVLMMSAEDDAEDTLVPRLQAAGADLDRVALIPDTTLNPERLAAHCDALDNPRLLVIDPFPSFVPGGMDAYKSQYVRRVLGPVLKLGNERSLAVVVIEHLNRRTDVPNALARIANSQGTPQLCRSVLIWGADPSDPDGDDGAAKVLTVAKSNLARSSASAAFRIEEVKVSEHIRQPRLVHTGESDARSADVVDGAEARGATQEAMVWLRDYLAAGSVEAEIAKKDAADHGISNKCLRTARERVARHYRPGGSSGPYVWELRPGQPRATGVPMDVIGHSGAFRGIHNESGGNQETLNAQMPVDARGCPPKSGNGHVDERSIAELVEAIGAASSDGERDSYRRVLAKVAPDHPEASQ
jgi:hypothetical protein